MRSILVFAALWGSAFGVQAGPGDHGPSELIFYHVNDLFAAPGNPDDRYTGTVTLAARHRGWELTLSEYMFTDRHVNMIRFDETSLTLAHDFRPGDRGWVVRAEIGVIHVGDGIFGQRFQNFVHRALDQDEYFLQYVRDGRHLFLGFVARRPFVVRDRYTVMPRVEVETAGFKRHALLGAGATIEIAPQFNLLAEAGFRWTKSDFGPLEPFIESSEPEYGFGVSYRRWFDVRWTRNYFGTGERHWHLLWRIPIKRTFGGGFSKD